MKQIGTTDHELSRRDFLKWLLASGGALTLSPLLNACSAADLPSPTSVLATNSISPTLAPSTTPQDDLLAGLQDLDLDSFLDEAYRRWMLRDPEGITLNGLSDLFGVKNDTLNDTSDGFIRETQRLQSGILELLGQYDTTTLTTSQAFNARLYAWFLQDQERGFKYTYSDYQVFPFLNSLAWNMNYLFTEAQPMHDLEDVQETITRFGMVQTRCHQVADGLKIRQEKGVILPAFLISDAIQDLKQYTMPRSYHPFYQSFASRIDNISSISAQDRSAVKEQAGQAITESVIPGFQTLVDLFNELRSTSPKEVGIWRFSNGQEYYSHLLQHFTTTDLSPDEIHQIGLDNVERIQAELRTEFTNLGYPADESIKTLIERLSEDNGYLKGVQVEKVAQSAIDMAIGLLDQAFEYPLRQEIKVIGGEQGNYFVNAPRDGSRQPAFYAASAYSQPGFPIKSIAFHEAVPGHGYQFDVASQVDLPLYRDAAQYDGYLEGWALYAERLMWELGAYDDDPAGNIGRLDLELLRAVRCVIDTGIHSKKWTYEQASQYMQEARGAPGDGEIRRYIMWPAQAVSYYIGFQKILELRQMAKTQMGTSFDIKKFHTVILGSGQVPLPILEELVRSYIVGNG